MKQQKFVDSIDLNKKRNLKNKIYVVLKNQKAFSLIELMVTTAIGAIVSLGIATVFVFAMEQFTILIEKNESEQSALQISYYLKHYLSQAVDVYAVKDVTDGFVPPVCPNASVAPTCNPSRAGQLDVDFELLAPGRSAITSPDTGAFTRLAVFNRESAYYSAGTSGLPTSGSDLKATGIFIKDTDATGINPDARGGAVVFDFSSTGPIGTTTLIPTTQDMVFYRIHNIRVQRMDCRGTNGYAVEVVTTSTSSSNNGVLLNCLPEGWTPAANSHYKVKTVTLEIVTRYYRTATKSQWNFRTGVNSDGTLVGGAAGAPYRDIVQTIKVNLKNNVLTNISLVGSPNGDERVHGSLYFYDYLIPAVRE